MGSRSRSFIDQAWAFTSEPPLIPTDLEDVAEGTRPMVPIHFTFPGHVIRFVACHWTAFDTAASRLARERLADVLRRDIHAFLEPEVPESWHHSPHRRHRGPKRGTDVRPCSSTGSSGGATGSRAIAGTGGMHRSGEFGCTTRHGDILVSKLLTERREPSKLGRPGPISESPTTGEHLTMSLFHVACSSESSVPRRGSNRVVSTPIMQDESGLPRPFEPGSGAAYLTTPNSGSHCPPGDLK